VAEGSSVMRYEYWSWTVELEQKYRNRWTRTGFYFVHWRYLIRYSGRVTQELQRQFFCSLYACECWQAYIIRYKIFLPLLLCDNLIISKRETLKPKIQKKSLEWRKNDIIQLRRGESIRSNTHIHTALLLPVEVYRMAIDHHIRLHWPISTRSADIV